MQITIGVFYSDKQYKCSHARIPLLYISYANVSIYESGSMHIVFLFNMQCILSMPFQSSRYRFLSQKNIDAANGEAFKASHRLRPLAQSNPQVNNFVNDPQQLQQQQLAQFFHGNQGLERMEITSCFVLQSKN